MSRYTHPALRIMGLVTAAGRGRAQQDELMAPAWVAVLLRVTGAMLGGYAFSGALVALLAAALALAGMARSEAVALAAMLGFVLYLMVLLWAFSVRSLARLWAVLAGGSVLGYGLLRLIR